jgi:hypothetical protein
MSQFSTWLDALIEEKELETETFLEVEGPSGTNYIPLEILVNAIKNASTTEQDAIKRTIVQIDFANGSIMHYFNHLAKAIAV